LNDYIEVLFGRNSGFKKPVFIFTYLLVCVGSCGIVRGFLLFILSFLLNIMIRSSHVFSEKKFLFLARRG
jgi:hypothetical protein